MKTKSKALPFRYQAGGTALDPKAQAQLNRFQNPYRQGDLSRGTPSPSQVQQQQVFNDQLKLQQQRAELQNKATAYQTPERRGAVSKATAIVTHPMSAIRYSLKGQPVPDYLDKAPTNPFDEVVNTVNPYFYGKAVVNVANGLFHPINSSKTLAKAGINAITNLSDGRNVYQDGSNQNALSFLGDAALALPLLGEGTKALSQSPLVKKYIANIHGIPFGQEAETLSPTDLKDYRKLQEIGRMDDLGKTQDEQVRYALANNLSEHHFQNLFDVDRQTASNNLQGIRTPTEETYAQRMNRMFGAPLEDAFSGVGEDEFHQPLHSSNGLTGNLQPLFQGRGSVSTKSPQWQYQVNGFKEALGDRIKAKTINYLSDYPYHTGPVEEKIKDLFLSHEEKGLSAVADKVKGTTDNVQSGKVYTGSLSTSHNSYLPQLKQVFNYDQGSPVFLGYKPMNSLGYLNRSGISHEEIGKYLNTEINQLVKAKKLPANLQRPFLRDNELVLPQYGVKQFKKGGYYNPYK